ncbi:MAG: hypothetical protein Ct9H90mP27_0800 [Gammaproteobacteria bacterium]|nr:MAG: hypothetical protein Ct9H90mP27_0800 [Gammaproteobacteria bacterium]
MLKIKKSDEVVVIAGEIRDSEERSLKLERMVA